MTEPFVAACVQNRAVNDTGESLRECLSLVRDAHGRGARLICTPEFCGHLHVDDDGLHTGAAIEAEHAGLAEFRETAARLSCWILVGSLGVLDDSGGRRNRSYLLGDDGAIVARYDKIHMFDVNLGNDEVYRESDWFDAGDRVVSAASPFGVIGFSVCYDLRFAALYRLLAQRGAALLAVPAAFMHTTGKAHWHVLNRSRAIETGSYVLAPCQYGYHGKARTYGHSLIVDPWGEVLAEGAEDGPDVILADIDLAEVERARARVPALNHDQPLAFEAADG